MKRIRELEKLTHRRNSMEKKVNRRIIDEKYENVKRSLSRSKKDYSNKSFTDISNKSSQQTQIMKNKLNIQQYSILLFNLHRAYDEFSRNDEPQLSNDTQNLIFMQEVIAHKRSNVLKTHFDCKTNEKIRKSSFSHKNSMFGFSQKGK